MRGTGDSVGPLPHEASGMGAGFEIARREQAHVGMIPSIFSAAIGHPSWLLD